MTSRLTALEGLLEICDRIRDWQAREQGLASPEDAQETRAQVHELRDLVFHETQALQHLPAASELSDEEVLSLALLFHRRIGGRSEAMSGGELVGLLRQAGYDRGAALALLQPEAPLRRSGWLYAQTHPQGFDPIDSAFAATPAALSLFWRHGGPAAAAGPKEDALLPYRDEEECLWELHDWRNQCMLRAETLFPNEAPRPALADGAPSRHKQARGDARAALLRIRKRLRLTPGGSEFCVERFRRKHALNSEHLLLVCHLLFSELVEGEPYISALECLRVAAETRTDLFRKRRLVGPKGKLRRNGIVLAADNGDLHKSLAVDLTLADWAADELLEGVGRLAGVDDGELGDLLRGGG